MEDCVGPGVVVPEADFGIIDCPGVVGQKQQRTSSRWFHRRNRAWHEIVRDSEHPFVAVAPCGRLAQLHRESWMHLQQQLPQDHRIGQFERQHSALRRTILGYLQQCTRKASTLSRFWKGLQLQSTNLPASERLALLPEQPNRRKQRALLDGWSLQHPSRTE